MMNTNIVINRNNRANIVTNRNKNRKQKGVTVTKRNKGVTMLKIKKE